jgi:hypothetical protein
VSYKIFVIITSTITDCNCLFYNGQVSQELAASKFVLLLKSSLKIVNKIPVSSLFYPLLDLGDSTDCGCEVIFLKKL